MSIKNLTLSLMILALMFCASACTVARIEYTERSSPQLVLTTTPPEQVVELVPASPMPADSPVPAVEWQSITPPDESVIFEIPASWRHYGQETNWSPDEGKTLIGLRMGWNRPGQAIETGLLPEGAKIVESETEMIHESSVRRFRVESAGEFETHLIFVRADSMVFDFFLHTPDEAAMDDLYPVLVHAVESAVFP